MIKKTTLPLLFITATRLGDAVLSTPVLEHFRNRFPDSPVHIACGSAAAPLFAAIPNLAAVHVMHKKPFAGHWRTLLRATMPLRWAAVIDLRCSLTPYVLRTGERWRFEKKPDAPRGKVAMLAHGLGLPALPAPRLYWSAEDDARAAALIGDDPRPLLTLAPIANWRGKEWPLERFAALIPHFPGFRVAICGAPSEREAAQPLLTPDVLDCVGTLPLLALAALFSRTRLFIGNDSGLMHMAAASGAPTLGLFGPSNHVDFAPVGKHTALVRTPESMAELISAPDYNHHTTGTLMGSLTLESVVAAAKALYESSHDAVRN